LSTVTIPSSAPQELVELGLAAGILIRDAAGKVTVRGAWFEDPGRYLSRILSDPDQREALLNLAEELVAAVEAELDLHDISDDEQWIPLKVADSPQVGIYAMVEVRAGDALLSLGGRLASAEPGSGLESTLTVAVPLLRIHGSDPQSSVAAPAEFVIGSADGAIRLAAKLVLPDSGLSDQQGGVELDGASLNLTVPTAPGGEPVLGMLLQGLRLPGDPVPHDLLLSDAGDLTSVATKILIGLAEGQAGSLSDELAHVLAMAGLHPAQDIPELPIDDALEQGLPAIQKWLESLATKPAATAWLKELAGLLGLPASAVSGDGTEASPLLVAVSVAPDVAVTLVVTSDPATGGPVLKPGVDVSLAAPQSAALDGRIFGAVDLCEATLGPAPKFVPLPGLRLGAELGDPSAELVRITPPSPAPSPVAVGYLRLGLTFVGGELGPLAEARNVTIGSVSHPVLDLSSADAVMAAAGAALDDVLDDLLEALSTSREAKALLALAGTRAPEGADEDDWPALVALDDLFRSPLETITCYHSRVLAQPDAWGLLAAELARLLSAAGVEASVRGSGTRLGPWSLSLFDNRGGDDAVRGRVELEAWTGEGVGPQLHLGLRIAPEELDIDDYGLELAYRSEIVRFDLPPTSSCPGPARAAWLPSHRIELTLGDTLELDLGPLELLAGSVRGSFEWIQERGIGVGLLVLSPSLRLEDVIAPLPDVAIESGANLPTFDPDLLPLAQLEQLAGYVLGSIADDWGWRLGALLGWQPRPEDLRLKLSELPELPLVIPATAWPRLSLRDLLDDPAAAIQEWADALAGSHGATDLGTPVAGWIATLLAGAAVEGGHLSAQLAGTGSYEDPWTAPLSLGAIAPALLGWIDPAPPPLGGMEPWASHFQPAELAEGETAPPTERLVALLRRGGAVDPRLADVLGDRDDLATVLEALITRLADSDGFVKDADQAATGFVQSQLGPVAHLQQPARFDPAVHLPSGPAEADRVFVSAALPGAAPWPGETPDKRLDLIAPNLDPSALDLSKVSGPGPWFIRLPTRAEAGPSGLSNVAGRLRRAVDAISRELGGDDVALIAHSSAGISAHLVAASGGISDLVTFGTPHGGASFEFLDQPSCAEAIRLLQRLDALVDPAIASPAELAPIHELLATLGAALDGYVPDEHGLPVRVPFAATDFTAPAAIAIPGGVTARAVVASYSDADLRDAIAALARAVLATTAAQATEATPTAELGGLGIVIPVAHAGEAAGDVAMDARLRLDALAVRLDSATGRSLPRLTAHVDLRRIDGWLAGGPTPAHPPSEPRDPRVRWAELELAFDFDPLAISTRIVLHDASVFGVARERWVIDGDFEASDGPLPPEARVLLGEVARGISPLPTTGALSAFATVLERMALASVAEDGTFAFVQEGLEGLLADPRGYLGLVLGEATKRGAFMSALGALTGGTFSQDGNAVSATLPGGLVLAVRSGPPLAAAIRLPDGTVLLGPLAELRGEISLSADDHLAADLTVAGREVLGPGLSSELRARVDSLAPEPVRIWLERTLHAAADSVPYDELELYPDPDEEALAARASELLIGELARLILQWLVGGPGVAGRRVRSPLALLLRPRAWLLHTSTLGSTSGDLRPAAVPPIVDMVRGLLGLSGDPGALPLPWGLVLGTSSESSGLRVAIESDDWLDAGAAELMVELSTVISAEGAVAPSVGLRVRLGDLPDRSGIAGAIDLDEISLEIRFDGSASAQVELAPSGDERITLGLVPSMGLAGLADLATGIATQAVLPLALDALVSSPAGVGAALAQVGDGLGLRKQGHFNAAELCALAAAPSVQLVARLQSGAASTLAAVQTIADTVLAPNSVVAVGRTLTINPDPTLSVSFTVPQTGSVTVCVEAQGVGPIPGLEVGALVCATDQGLGSLRVHVEAGDNLFEVSSLSLRLFATLAVGDAAAPGGDRIEAGLWLSEDDAGVPTGPVVRVPFGGQVDVVCRTGTADSTDLGACVVAAVRGLLVPLLLEQVLAIEAVIERLDKTIAGSGANAVSIGRVLSEADILDRSQSGNQVTYSLEPDFLDSDQLGERAVAIGAQAVKLLAAAGWPAGAGALAPLTISPAAKPGDQGREIYGLRIGLPEGLHLFDAGPVSVELESPSAKWIDADPTSGLEVFLLSAPSGTFAPADVEFHPAIDARGIGVRVKGQPGPKLINAAASVESVALHGTYERDFGVNAGAVTRAGGRLQVRGLTIPLGKAAGGENPVASKLLSQSGETQQAGDTRELAPGFSPELILLKVGPQPVQLRLRVGDEDQGPWWIPIQQRFGPIYVEQVGFDAIEKEGALDEVSVLLDGGASVAGLAVGLDDLSVTIPWRKPYDVTQWKLGLAGLGVGYSGASVTVAGGLRRRATTPPDYVGMLAAQFSQYGLGAVGGYAEYPLPGTTNTYTSFFLFAALNGPIGGPPAFFVVGVGAGVGLNRRLVVPAEVTDVPQFALVAAMDPAGAFVSDPMGSLDKLASSFPAERGALWLAAGVSFTSFALVRSIAVLAVSVSGNELEVALLGLSRADLPVAAPIARVELALRAHFSTRDAILSIQAQLTENSWLINEGCRLTGGFAFYIWFRDGDFVLTLGGYHPDFRAPSKFPVVPRLGFNWPVSNQIVLKGESYFALTATCVMAGGRLEASYRSGTTWASFVAGIDAIASWDPVFYDLRSYVRVSAGVDIEVCVWPFGCGHVRLSLSIGAEVHVWGPKLHGEATLDLQVLKVTVGFGVGEAEAGREPIGWAEFYAKYLVAGDSRGETMGASIVVGALTPEGRSNPPEGLSGDPWFVGPDFVIATRTRAASNAVNGASLAPITQQPIDLGPMRVAGANSMHTITLHNGSGQDVTGQLLFEATRSNVPEGTWRVLPQQPAPEANVRPAFVGGQLTASSQISPDSARAKLEMIEEGPDRKPLPFFQEQAERVAFAGDVEAADAYVETQPTDTAGILATAAERLGYVRRLLALERTAPPLLAPLTEGMVELEPSPPVAVTPVPEPEEPVRPSNEIAPPRLVAILRGSPPADVRGSPRTTVTASELPRVPAPRWADAATDVARPGAGRIELREPPLDETETAEGTTLTASAGMVPTSTVGGLRELRGGLRTDATVAASLQEIEAALGGESGASLLAGDLMVLELTRAEFDDSDERPRLLVKGDQAVRALALDRAGDVAEDETGEALEFQVPVGAWRIGLLGGGQSAGESQLTATGLPGWDPGSMIAQIAADTYLAGGCVLRTSSPPTFRQRQMVTAAMVRAADAVYGQGLVSTILPPASSIAVALETAETIDDALAGLVLGLEGAHRLVEDGVESKPVLVVSGPRVYAAFDVVPEASGPMVVSIASDDRWALAGTLGADVSAVTLADRIASAGHDTLAASLISSPLGSSHVRWEAI
jgi:hypothetical protein